MITRLTALENEQSEDDEERREGLAVFDVDDRFQVLTDEKLAHENQSDVQQRPKGSETCLFDFVNGVESDEDDEWEVGVEGVSGEKRDETDRPRQVVETTVNFQSGEDREYKDTDDVNEDFKGRATD